MIDSTIISRILSVHFDQHHGTAYWLDKEQQLGIDVQKTIRSTSDFHLLGPMDVEQLRTRPLTDFIPRSFHDRLPEMLLSETGGTTGPPCRRVFTRQEFQAAFIRPWMNAVKKQHFPLNGMWLFVGPGGPHIISQAAREMARATGSLEPFSVDCDVRWFRGQDRESLGFRLYLEHVLEQAMNIISSQHIDVLFTTPILLTALAKKMTKQQRLQIAGIHTGGMAQKAELSERLHELFAAAVILPGYGNSLFGVAFEQAPPGQSEESVFCVDDPALWLQLVPITDTKDINLATVLPEKQTGRVVVHRLDPSFLLINMIERDSGHYPAGSNRRKLQNIGPVEHKVVSKGGSVY
ncbi:MAG: hypothetical protein DSY70_07405 [Desulfobulbus sp.]|nr:MAG: hypothetical protein DSY70_07405 [Desulfobulbus sp.]